MLRKQLVSACPGMILNPIQSNRGIALSMSYNKRPGKALEQKTIEKVNQGDGVLSGSPLLRPPPPLISVPLIGGLRYEGEGSRTPYG